MINYGIKFSVVRMENLRGGDEVIKGVQKKIEIFVCYIKEL